MNLESDQPPLPEPSACLEDLLAVAQDRIRVLEEALCEAEQELAAANEIVEEQDWQIEDLKVQLDGADMMLEEAAEARRKLQRRLAELEDAEKDDLCPVIVPVPNEQAPPQQPGYPPGYRPKPIVEAMIAQYQAGQKK